MPKLTHYLVPKEGGKDTLNLSHQGFDALAIELVRKDGVEIIYRATSNPWADYGPPESVFVSDYKAIPRSKYEATKVKRPDNAHGGS